MDRGPLSPHFNQDVGNYYPVTVKTGQRFFMREDLYDKLVRMYDDGSPNHVMERISLHLPRVRVSNKFVSELNVTQHLPQCLGSLPYRPQKCPVDLHLPLPLSGKAYVTIQPWPPPLPTNPRSSGLCSAIKPVVYSPLPEGFKGGREISNTATLSLFQIRHFILTDPDSHSQGGGEEKSI